MTVVLQVYDELRSAVLFDCNDPTGTNSGLYGSVTTELSSDFDIGAPTLQSTNVTPQDIDATFSAFSKRATATMKLKLIISATSYDNLTLAVGTLAQFLTQGCTMKYAAGTNTYFIDVLPSQTPAALSGGEIAIYQAAALFKIAIDVQLQRQPYLRGAALSAATNILSNATMLRDSNQDGTPDSWTLTAWSPLAITGLYAWYDFSDTTTLYTDTGRTTPSSSDGDLIKGVADKSGNARHISEATNPPTRKNAIQNSRAVLRFDGVNDIISRAANVSQPITIYIVVKQTKPVGSSGYLLGGGGAFAGGMDVSGDLTEYAGSFLTGGTDRSGAWHIFTYVWNGASSSIKCDGTSDASGTANTNGTGSSLPMLGSHTGSANFATADMGEVIIATTTHTTDEADTIRTYAQARWGTP